MDKEIIDILKSHGCLYMAEDYKELLTDIQEHYKKTHALQLLQPAVIGRSKQLKAFSDYAQKRMWEDGDKDMSDFVDEFLSL